MPREPLYKQTQTEMLRRIEAGTWAEGLRLGNEFELAAEFGVSQGTMRRALITLEGMGYLHRKPGRGTIVARPQPKPAEIGLDRLSGPGGAALDLEVFRSRHALRAPDAGAEALFGPGRLHDYARTLKSGGERFALEEVHLPETICPDPDEDLPADLGEILDRIGLSPARIEDRLHTEETSMGDAVALSVDRHTPLLCLTRVAYDGDGAALIRQVLRIAGPAAYGVTLDG
jgi:DNA-binding GntR family transcriptional regulator